VCPAKRGGVPLPWFVRPSPKTSCQLRTAFGRCVWIRKETASGALPDAGDTVKTIGALPVPTVTFAVVRNRIAVPVNGGAWYHDQHGLVAGGEVAGRDDRVATSGRAQENP